MYTMYLHFYQVYSVKNFRAFTVLCMLLLSVKGLYTCMLYSQGVICFLLLFFAVTYIRVTGHFIFQPCRFVVA